MKKIYVSSGHSNRPGNGRDAGASGNGFIEGVEMAELRNIIVKELEQLGAEVIVDKDDSILSDTIKEFKPKTTENDIVLDLHLNAGVVKATGVETLVPDPPTQFEINLAEEISKTVSDILGIPVRGAKGVKTEADSQHKRLGFMRLAGANVLLETCFISNPNDMKVYREKRVELGKAIAKVLFEATGSVNTSNLHTVVAGDSLSKIATKYRTTITKLKSDNGLNSDLIKVGQKLKV